MLKYKKGVCFHLGIIDFSKLQSSEIIIREPIGIFQDYWYKQSYSCIGAPKKNQTLLFLKETDALLVSKKGLEINASRGDILYMPKGSEYSVIFQNTSPNTVQSIVLHFSVFSGDTGEEINFSNKEILLSGCFSSEEAFEKIASLSYKSNIPYSAVYSLLYGLLNNLSLKETAPDTSLHQKLIKSGIAMLETRDIKINEIAAELGISGCYFRRIFKEYTDKTPNQYRLEYKIKKASQLITETTLSITEIAEMLCFSDIYHFSKEFKKRTGQTPSEFRKNNA